MEEYKDKASFEEFFKQNYVPLDYKSIQNEMREAAGDGWSLFTDEYKFRGKIDKKDFIVHMTGDAYCTFEEIVENAIDELNSGILDIVMEIGNEMEFDNDTAEIYFDTIEKQLKDIGKHQRHCEKHDFPKQRAVAHIDLIFAGCHWLSLPG